MRKYVIMGVQGSGKGTQSQLLAADFDLVHISRGRHLPLERAEPHQDGRPGQADHGRGGAGRRRPGRVGGPGPADPARLELRLHHRRLSAEPRGRPSSSWRATTSTGSSQLELPDSEVRRRVLARRLCANCGMDYNLHRQQPARARAVRRLRRGAGHQGRRHRGGAGGPAAGLPREDQPGAGPVPAQGVRDHRGRPAAAGGGPAGRSGTGSACRRSADEPAGKTARSSSA